MDYRHPVDGGVTLSFDEAIWDTESADGLRTAPTVSAMAGVPQPASPSASRKPDIDWLLTQVSAQPGVSLLALPDLVRRPGVSVRALDALSVPTVSVDLAEDESAVLLVECDGVVGWQFPDSAEVTPAPGTTRGGMAPSRRVRFSVKAPGAAAPVNSQQRNIFTDWMIDRIKPVVLKFVAARAAGTIVRKLESSKRTGPVMISAIPDASQWEKPESFSALNLPQPSHILLFVHGTFSSTAGGFGDLCATRWGLGFLKVAEKRYDALIGYDHRTLSVDPLENAQGLYAVLQMLKCDEPPTIDIICHSRGALVVRSLIEKVLPGKPWQAIIRNVVFVGATNVGTELARPENWHSMLDLVTNLALASRKALMLLGAPHAAVAAGELVEGVSDFVRYLVDVAVEEQRVPGLSAMNPEGDFVRDINRTESRALIQQDSQSYAIVSNFRPVLIDGERHEPREFPRRLALMMANGFVGALMKQRENDLVVNVSSMSSSDTGIGTSMQAIQDFGSNPLVYHTNYFIQPETVDAVAQWLGMRDIHVRETIAARLVNRVVVANSDTLVKDALSKAGKKKAHYIVTPNPVTDDGEAGYCVSSVDEFRQEHHDQILRDVLVTQKTDGTRTVTAESLLHSLHERAPSKAADAGTARLDYTVVLKGGQPVGVVPTGGSAIEILARANVPADAGRTTRGRTTRGKGSRDLPAPAPGVPLSPDPLAIAAKPEPVICNVQAEMPRTVQVQQSAQVTVTLSADDIAAAEAALSARSPVKLDQRPVTIEVVPRVGFKLKSNATDDSRVILPEPPPPGEPCIMDVEVIATHEGPGEIWAIVRQGPVRCVTLVLKPQITGSPAATGEAPLESRGVIEAGEDVADVATLEITQQRNGSETRFLYSLYVPSEVYDRFESPAISGDIEGWVNALYKGIETAWLGSAGNREIFHDQLKAHGAALFHELIPPVLADLLWRLHSAGKLKSILVRSDEPFVPWEIAFLDDPNDAEHAQACFLGELGLCRWLYGAVPATRIRIRPGRMRYVVPCYPDPRYRLSAAEELETPMLDKMGATPVVAHYRDVIAALQSGEFDLLHFAGHGCGDGNAANAAVLLEGSFAQVGGEQRYVTEPLAASVVAQKAKLRGPDNNRPLVVLNACQVARIGFSLTSMGGFAPAFLGARMGQSRSVGEAGAFVSSLWSVGDEPASVFARTLYEVLQVEGGTTIATAVKAAREAARAAGDPTWLAYAVYAHPNCHVEFTP